MEVPQEMDDYIKESIDYSLGLPVSTKTLQLKLQASEDARKQLQGQYFVLHSRLKEKDETIERTKSESSMNAQALKKFVEENQKLAQECSNLLNQCSRWEKECSLYDHDREALMEFGNEADERAKEAEIRVLETEIRVLETENELRRLAEALEFYKHESEMRMVNHTKATEELIFLRQKINELERIKSQGSPDSHLACSRCSSEKAENHNPQPYILGDAFGANVEGQLLDSVVVSMINKDEVAANALAFLKENSGVESCQRLLKLWESCSLRPSTQNVLALAAEIKLLQNDKEHLRINLTRAEEEVKVLFDENTILDEENKRLLRQYNRERNHQGSGGKHSSSASAKGSKRKSSPRRSSSVERIIDFGQDSPRQPLSPLQYNSPDSRMHKK